jgi:oxygen-dependent protoporphyrinogen oxidase
MSQWVEGFLLEAGPDCFVSQKPWGVRLAGELGLTIVNTAPAGATYVLSGGRLHPLPEGTMLMVPTRFLPLARSRLLSWPGKVRMGMDLLLPRGGGEDESLGAFVTRRLGKEALEKIAEPLVAGVHAADPDGLSLLATFPRFKLMEERDRSLIVAMVRARRRMAQARRAQPAGAASPPTAFVTLEGGLEKMVTALAHSLPPESLRLGARVTRVSPVPGHPGGSPAGYNLTVEGWERTPRGLSMIEPVGPFDAVILALPAGRAAEVLTGLDDAFAAELAGIQTVSAVTVSLAWKNEQVGHDLDGFGMVVPRRERRPIMGVTWTSSKFPGRAPAGHVLLRAFLGGAKGPDILALSDDEITDLVLRELAPLLGVRKAPLLVRVHRWPEAMPQYHVGHLARLERIEEHLSRHPGLALAGGSYRGIGIPDCIAGGLAAAESVLGGPAVGPQVTLSEPV